MRTHALFAFALLLAAGLALAGGFTFKGSPVNFTDCAAGGSSASAVKAGLNLMRVSATETVFVCFASSASTCASGGELLPPGFAGVVNLTSDQISVSCRSALSTGDVTFTPVAY